MIILLIIIVLFFLLILALCKISAISDEEAERIFKNYLEQKRKQI